MTTQQGELRTRFLIWATGEYQYPDPTPFPGAQWCVHYAQVDNWEDYSAPDYTVIGGYESGVDAAVNLVRLGLGAGAQQRGAGAWGPFGNSDCCEDCEC